MPLSFRDTLTGRVGTFAPVRGRPIALYVCGPTVYDGAHVGHARTYLYFDVLRRYFRARGQPVRHVMNITDFEDKITARAVARKLSWVSLARKEERRFVADMSALNIIPPDVLPRSSQFVPAMVRLIQRLERTGRTYERDDSFYFEPSREDERGNFPVGKELEKHAVPEPGVPPPFFDVRAREILLWRRQLPPAPSWPSPWGAGAPGWHLECYTMAQRHLRLPVDLHGGGLDLVFPHHYAENVIARELGGTTFSRRFLHTAFVTEDGRKMSKSVGNLVHLQAVLEDFSADALRWYLLRPPFHSPLEWDEEALRRAADELSEVRHRFRRSLPEGGGGSLPLRRVVELPRAVERAVEDGFAPDRGIAVLRNWANEIGRASDPRLPRGSLGLARGAYARAGELLGVTLN